jgi:predicted HTH domain antitoxin
MKITLELPDIPDVNHQYINEALIALLYVQGKLSQSQACQLLNLNRRAFEEMLPKYGFSILVDSEDNINVELNT